MKVLLGVGWLALILVGCVSGSGEFQSGYHEEYTLSEKNRQALMNLRQGMSLDEVRAMMGEPQMVDQYPSETIWYYRTRPTGLMSSTAGQQDFPDRSGRGADTNFTPLVFDDRHLLVAWGKDVVLP